MRATSAIAKATDAVIEGTTDQVIMQAHRSPSLVTTACQYEHPVPPLLFTCAAIEEKVIHFGLSLLVGMPIRVWMAGQPNTAFTILFWHE